MFNANILSILEQRHSTGLYYGNEEFNKKEATDQRTF